MHDPGEEIEEGHDMLSDLESACASPGRNSKIPPIRNRPDRPQPKDSVEGDDNNALGDSPVSSIPSAQSVSSPVSSFVSRARAAEAVGVGRKLTRREIVKQKQTIITPISIQNELNKYKIYSTGYCTEMSELLDTVARWWSVGYLKVFLLWTTWMTAGTVFYAVRNEFGWAKGFYMMVNVGYSIGW